MTMNWRHQSTTDNTGAASHDISTVIGSRKTGSHEMNADRVSPMLYLNHPYAELNLLKPLKDRTT